MNTDPFAVLGLKWIIVLSYLARAEIIKSIVNEFVISVIFLSNMLVQWANVDITLAHPHGAYFKLIKGA